MKFFWIVASSLTFFSAKDGCKKKNQLGALTPTGCYKGRLEVKGGCMNYTISVIDGNVDTSFVQSLWTDENTGKSYSNVFGLASRCTFPQTINAGDEFYFELDNTSVQNCAVCMMYYPTPAKKLSIKVIQDPCPK